MAAGVNCAGFLIAFGVFPVDQLIFRPSGIHVQLRVKKIGNGDPSVHKLSPVISSVDPIIMDIPQNGNAGQRAF